MRLRPRLCIALLSIFLAFFAAQPARAELTLETKYAVIRFDEETFLNDFLWRITGSRLSAGQSPNDLAINRVDEIVERVESLLDMYPSAFRFDIEITPQAGEDGPPAHYSHERRCIYVSPATVTDGMLAHEIAHAVINAQFPVPPPEKAQEILARYVDQNLWSEAI